RQLGAVPQQPQNGRAAQSLGPPTLGARNQTWCFGDAACQLTTKVAELRGTAKRLTIENLINPLPYAARERDDRLARQVGGQVKRQRHVPRSRLWLQRIDRVDGPSQHREIVVEHGL